jgi:prepilin-type processing-associated H-X9-DG protein
MMFAHDNGDQFPQTFEQISAYLKSTDQPSIDASQYEIVYEGALGALTNASATIVVREKQAFQTPNGAWARTYGFADGHAEVHVSADGNFEVYERKNMVSLK